jgi:hypothetical protein
MKNKFKPGDKVIEIKFDRAGSDWIYRVSNEEIKSVMIYKDKAGYFLLSDITKDGYEVPESQLFTKEEAIKFLQENLNDK